MSEKEPMRTKNLPLSELRVCDWDEFLESAKRHDVKNFSLKGNDFFISFKNDSESEDFPLNATEIEKAEINRQRRQKAKDPSGMDMFA